MIPEYFDKTWLEEYAQNLNQFKEDLDLKIQGFDIYISMDSYDIYKFCFPFALHSRVNENWDDEDYMRYYYEYQISRSTMFFMLENIYHKPNILLAPYVTEVSNFIESLDIETDRYIYDELKRYQNNPNPEIENIVNECKSSGNYKNLIDYINENYEELIYFFSRGYTSSIDMLNNLLNNFLTDDLAILFQNGNKTEEELLYAIVSDRNSKMIDYADIEREVEGTRNTMGRYFQNKRDAEAIYSIFRLNEMYNADKKAFCLFSSAPHLVDNLMTPPKLNVNTSIINNKKFKILRDPRYFMDIMFEINNYFNYGINKTSIEAIDCKDLRLSVMKTLSRLEFYNSYLMGAGGRLKAIIEKQVREELSLDEAIDKMDLSMLLDDYINIKKNYQKYSELDKQIASSIINAYGDEPFSRGLLLRRLEIEKKNLRFVITALKQSDKKHFYVTSFILPFNLHIMDEQISDIIEGIISSSTLGRNEFRADREISDRTFDTIFPKIINLLDLAENIDGDDEKVLILQFCFLYINRYDLVDHIYDLFCNFVNDSIKREMSYIYIIGFIKKFRVVKIKDSKYYLDMANLCDKYIYLSNEKITKDLKSYDFHKCEEYYIIRDKDTKSIFISKSKEIHSDMIITPIDIRFFHLKTTIINRFIHDFELIELEQIQNMISEYEPIFIPLVTYFSEDYKIAIKTAYAYFLSLCTGMQNYKLNLEKALDIMDELYSAYVQTPDKYGPYWGYVRHYQYGYINYKYSSKCDPARRLNFVKKAKNFFELSAKELPSLAVDLHRLIADRINLCDEQIRCLIESQQ